MTSMRDPIPVFLVGVGRSGTTVARKSLAYHPEVAVRRKEFRILAGPGGLLDVVDALSDRWDPWAADAALCRFVEYVGEVRPVLRPAARELSRRLSTVSLNRRWVGAPADQDYIRETSPAADPRPVVRTFVHHAYRVRERGATHWVDDTPYAGLHARRIRRTWPGARFVHCVRHPMDVYASHVLGGHRWTPADPEVAARRIADVLRATTAQLPAGSVTLRLEDVVDDRPAAVAGLWDALGLAPHPDALAAAVAVYDRGKANVGRRADLDDRAAEAYGDHLAWAEDALGYA